ncbi:hypothetical protein EC971742_1902, partial [Escherichia coli 97.1742]
MLLVHHHSIPCRAAAIHLENFVKSLEANPKQFPD